MPEPTDKPTPETPSPVAEPQTCIFCGKEAHASKIIQVNGTINEEQVLPVSLGSNSPSVKQERVTLAHVYCFLAFSLLNSKSISTAYNIIEASMKPAAPKIIKP